MRFLPGGLERQGNAYWPGRAARRLRLSADRRRPSGPREEDARREIRGPVLAPHHRDELASDGGGHRPRSAKERVHEDSRKVPEHLHRAIPQPRPGSAWSPVLAGVDHWLATLRRG